MIAGQDAMLERVLVCLLAQGHLLIEGVPGLAKTLTIKTAAGVLAGSFSRIHRNFVSVKFANARLQVS